MRILLLVFLLILTTCSKPAEQSSRPVEAAHAPAEKSLEGTGDVDGARIAISAADRACERDEDCDNIANQCSCACGQGVNAKYIAKYQDLLNEACEKNPPRRMCKMDCRGTNRCVDKVCVFLHKPSTSSNANNL